MKIALTISMLVVSNVFMTWAWYGHLKKGSGADGKVYIMQNLCCPVIGKRHMIEDNAGIFQLDRRFFMVQFFGV